MEEEQECKVLQAGGEMNRAEWYLKGFNGYPLRIRLAVFLIKVFYKLRLIGEEDVKRYVNGIINAYLISLAKKHGLRIAEVKIGDEE